MSLPQWLWIMGADWLVALMFYPALTLKSQIRILILAGLAIPILLSPLAIPIGAPVDRFGVAVIAVLLVMKLYDAHREALRGSRPTFRSFAIFLANSFAHVRRRLAVIPQPSRGRSLIRTVFGFIGLWAVNSLIQTVWAWPWHSYPFMIEHSVKAVLFVAFVLALMTSLESLWRLLGGRYCRFAHLPFLASTPADFWRRYNRPAHQALYENSRPDTFFCSMVI